MLKHKVVTSKNIDTIYSTIVLNKNTLFLTIFKSTVTQQNKKRCRKITPLFVKYIQRNINKSFFLA